MARLNGSRYEIENFKIKEEIDVEYNCWICNQSFLDEEKLKNHVEQHDISNSRKRRRGLTILPLQNAKNPATPSIDLDIGIKIKEEIDLDSCFQFACHECPKTFDLYDNLQIHLETHKDSLEIQEVQCQNDPIEAEFNSIKIKEELEFDYNCLECELSFKSNDLLESHSKTHKRRSSKNESTVDLNGNCDEVEVNHVEVNHVEIKDEIEFEYNCHECSMVFKSSNLLQSHIESHENSSKFQEYLQELSAPKKIRKEIDFEYCCEYCPTTFKCSNLLLNFNLIQSHIESHQQNPGIENDSDKTNRDGFESSTLSKDHQKSREENSALSEEEEYMDVEYLDSEFEDQEDLSLAVSSQPPKAKESVKVVHVRSPIFDHRDYTLKKKSSAVRSVKRNTIHQKTCSVANKGELMLDDESDCEIVPLSLGITLIIPNQPKENVNSSESSKSEASKARRRHQFLPNFVKYTANAVDAFPKSIFADVLKRRTKKADIEKRKLEKFKKSKKYQKKKEFGPPKNEFSCPICKEEFFLAKTYLKHYKTQHTVAERLEYSAWKRKNRKELKELQMNSKEKESTATNTSIKVSEPKPKKSYYQKKKKPRPVIINEAGKYACKFCELRFCTQRNLVRHQRTHPDLICKLCSLSCKTIEEYEKHQAFHEDPAPFKCSHCSIAFESEIELVEHQKKKLKEKRSQCDICLTYFSNRIFLNEHKRKNHQLKIPFDCWNCDKTFETYYLLLDHQGTEHKAKTHRHVCSVCPQRFRKKSGKFGLLAHEKEHRKCDYCDILFDTPELGDLHVKYCIKYRDSHSSNNRCDVCGKSIQLYSKFVQHMQLHDDPKAFHCDFCNRVFITRSDIRIHMYNHFKYKLKPCILCDEAFPDLTALEDHQNDKHSQTNLGTCKEKLKPIVMLQRLEDSEIHCKTCGKNFINQRLLKDHIKADHSYKKGK